MSIPVNINRNASPEQIYRQLLRLWRLHLSVGEPDLEQLREIHRALSIQETLLYETGVDLCLENLQQRLRDAFALGLELQLPLWAIAHGDSLKACLKEVQA